MKKKNTIFVLLIFFFSIFFIFNYHNQSQYSTETKINLGESESPIIFIGGFPRSGTTLIVMFI
jgi:uncharacterized alpha/beta hydrolase family protein